ncbi:tRNA lysidine(34) synthetase TilS, partial [Streptomyces sp. T21Q-yed]|nr:tRNA lysidine(34) synthetase TilS [Streptomyces sp. T21Q-yed]
MGPHPAVAAIRLAVRRVLHDILTDHSRSTDTLAPSTSRAISYEILHMTPPVAPPATSTGPTPAAYDTAREPSYELPGQA